MKHFTVEVKFNIDSCSIETINKFKVTDFERLGQDKYKTEEVKYVGDLRYKDNRIINAIKHIVQRYMDVIINYRSIYEIYNYAVLKDLNDKLYSARASEYYFNSHKSLNYFIKNNIKEINNEICIISYATDRSNQEYMGENWLVFNVVIFTIKEFIKFINKPRFVNISFNGRYVGRAIPFTIANGIELECSLSNKEDEEALNVIYGSEYYF